MYYSRRDSIRRGCISVIVVSKLSQDSDFQSQLLSSYSGSIVKLKTFLLIYFLFGLSVSEECLFLNRSCFVRQQFRKTTSILLV